MNVMKGENILKLNRKTLIEALQFYFDEMMENFPMIVDLDFSGDEAVLTLNERSEEQ